MEAQEKQFMRKIVRGQEDKLTEKEKSTFGHKLEIYQKRRRRMKEHLGMKFTRNMQTKESIMLRII